MNFVDLVRSQSEDGKIWNVKNPEKYQYWEAYKFNQIISTSDKSGFYYWTKNNLMTRNFPVLIRPEILDMELFEPKSPIEEAIEREVAGGVYMPNGDVQFRMRRIVNLTLNEAKKAVSNYGDCGYSCVVREAHKRIDALKVK